MNGGVPSSLGGRLYDMHVERDVIALLQAIRVSTLDPGSKDEVRDIIFAIQTDKNQALLDELQMYVSSLGFSIAGTTPELDTVSDAVPTTAPTPVPVPTEAASNVYGLTRPVPKLGLDASPAAPAVKVSAPVSEPPVPPVTATPVSDVPAELSEAAAMVTPVPVSEPVPEPAVEPTPEPEATPKPAVEPTPEPAREPEPTPVSEPGLVPESVPTPAADNNTPDPSARITEIKAAVNAAVGNPVNLIDATNKVGREYMTALLEAMKSVGGGGSVAPAMERLETAFAAVQQALQAAPLTHTQTASSTASSNPPVSHPSAASPDEAAANVPAPTSGYAAVQADTQSTESSETPIAETQTVPTATAVPAPPEVGVETSTKLTPLTKVVPPVSTAAAKAAEVQKPAPVTDSLMSEPVAAGLHQLLSEWKLFKSSGLLGTGPKGDAHPLYKELQQLQMNLVIAGRFEGATPDVRQSITDYMNGWRYEQGMTHDMQETFEHYLRRVVKTIIDKQAK